jgi:hypothetical protein
LQTLTHTLVEQVDRLVLEAAQEPLLSTTPTSIAIRQLAARNDALEKALREIALVVQEIELEVQKLAATTL